MALDLPKITTFFSNVMRIVSKTWSCHSMPFMNPPEALVECVGSTAAIVI